MSRSSLVNFTEKTSETRGYSSNLNEALVILECRFSLAFEEFVLYRAVNCSF